jgi:hypothetical protein
MKERSTENGSQLVLTEEELVVLKKILAGTSRDCKQSRVARVFMYIDMVLGKCTRLLLWILECAGVFWIYTSVTRFSEAIDAIKVATTPEALSKATTMLDAARKAAESTNSIVIAFCAALPGVIGALQIIRKKWKENGDTT